MSSNHSVLITGASTGIGAGVRSDCLWCDQSFCSVPQPGAAP